MLDPSQRLRGKRDKRSGRRLNALIAVVTLFAMTAPWPASAQQPEVATSLAFTEGPAVDRDGNVYFTEMVSQRIMKLTARRDPSASGWSSIARTRLAPPVTR